MDKTHISSLQNKMESIWEKSQQGEPLDAFHTAIEECIHLLDKGILRVATEEGENWVIHEWLKKAILLYFKTQKLTQTSAGDLSFFDKIPLKKFTLAEGVRAVPPAIARYGSHISKGAILMPSYINIGAFVGEGTMIDTWATVGSCAQIGKNVHISGGVGVGGVLEPLQAKPVIIEDNCFIGSRCILVEGVHIKSGAVLGAGVSLTGSTPIIDVTEKSPQESRGIIPPQSVVIPGSFKKNISCGGILCSLCFNHWKKKTQHGS